MFEFRFPADKADEGYEVAASIGGDMPATAGYEGHDVIRDLADAGHVVVITRWGGQDQGEAVLNEYIHDPKIDRATALAGAAPSGFLGAVDVHRG